MDKEELYKQDESLVSGYLLVELLAHLYKGKKIDISDPKKFMADLFAKLDVNGDGELKYREARDAAVATDKQTFDYILSKNPELLLFAATNKTLLTREEAPANIGLLANLKNLDVNNNNFIEPDELAKSIKSFELGPLFKKANSLLEKIYDKNQDGQISKAEEKEINKIYLTFDTNKDKEYAEQELLTGIETLELTIKADSLLKKSSDKDRNGKLSESEAAEMKRTSNSFDKNKDGSLSPTELKNLITALEKAQR